MPSYSITSLRSPSSSRLARAASVRPVFNPPARPSYAPANAPLSYDQQMGQLRAGNIAPDFSLSSADAGGGGGAAPPPSKTNIGTPSVGFSNSSNPAFTMGLPNVGGSASAGGFTVDYANDPILQQAQAYAQSQIAQAEASALGAERSALIRYGDPRLVSQVLGEDDEETANAAKGNAFSTVAELGRWNDRALSGIDTATNRSNLYFSSTRGRDRALQEEDLTRQTARTGNQLQDLLTGIATGLLNSKQGAISGLLGAEASAYDRAMQSALAQAALAAQPTYAPYPTGAPTGEPTAAPTAAAASPYSSILYAPYYEQLENPATRYRIDRLR